MVSWLMRVSNSALHGIFNGQVTKHPSGPVRTSRGGKPTRPAPFLAPSDYTVSRPGCVM